MLWRIGRFLVYAVLLGAAFLLDNWDEWTQKKDCIPREDAEAKLAPFGYQHLSQAGYRQPRDRNVRLVLLTTGVEPDEILDNVCRQRLFMTRLINRLEDQGASLIVIDKFFSPDSCPANDKGTASLSKLISKSKIPIVVGLSTRNLQQAELRSRRDPKTCLVLTQNLTFGADNPSSNVRAGLIRLNQDTRKIPLGWLVFADPQADSPPAPRPTLALAAAQRADSGISEDATLHRLIEENKHPFTSFIRESDIRTYSALSLVCANPAKDKADWERCQPPAHVPEGDDLRGHVIVVGDATAEDQHASVIGNVPGAVLQANYIESLLDGRLFLPIPDWASVVIYVVWIVIIHLVFWGLHSWWPTLPGWLVPELAVAICALLFFVLGGISYLVLVFTGYFVMVWIQRLSLLAVALKWIESLGHVMMAKHQQNPVN